MTNLRVYEIRLGAALDESWGDYFQAQEIARESGSCCRIRVQVRDQSELFGILKKVRDIAVPLISLCEIESSGGD